MSGDDSEYTDEEDVAEEDREFAKLKSTISPVEQLALLLARTGRHADLDKRARKKKGDKRKKEKHRSEESNSRISQEATVSQDTVLIEGPPPETATSTAVAPLHIQLATELLNAPRDRKVSRSQNLKIYSTSRTEWLPVIAFLDTGTSDNWISQRIIDRGTFRPHGGQVKRYASFYGATLRSDELVDITWQGEGSFKTHEASFRVGGANAPFDILFGWNILNSEEASACLTSNCMLDPAAVLVQLNACTTEKLNIALNGAVNESQAAEVAKQQEYRLKQLKDKEKSTSGAGGTKKEQLKSTE